GVAMAVTLSAFLGSFQKSADKWISQAIPADLFVTSSAKLAGIQNQPMKASIGDELLSIPEIELVDPVRLLQHDALDLRIFVISLNSDVYATRGKPIVLEGTLPDAAQREQNYVVLSENLARRRNLSVGNTFTMKTPTGEHTYTVGAIIIDYTSDQGSVLMDRSI